MRPTDRFFAVIAIIGVTVWAAASCRRDPIAKDMRAPATHAVTMEGTAFRPAVVTVRVGDRIVWRNKDFFPHTATTPAGAFDSGLIAAGASWTFTPDAPGVFDYTCTYHPTMTATVRVE